MTNTSPLTYDIEGLITDALKRNELDTRRARIELSRDIITVVREAVLSEIESTVRQALRQRGAQRV